ncbi:MAG TPA: hypothetical protein VFB69_04770 [Candidatus Dormibacteraeota bacterium]|nr:hypothetical protein [Candidatus Dormibacteraeota bacterium]
MIAPPPPAPDRIQIWSSQLAANDFPPVCAMTGRPAEVWRKFNFRAPPTWVYFLLFLIVIGLIGLIIFGVVENAVSEKASGHLPLTRAAQNRIRLFLWTVVALLPASIVLLIAGAALGAGTDSSTSGVGALCILLGALAFVAFIVGALTRSLFTGPRAKVYPPQPGYTDKIVELYKLHPAFVAAVQQQHAARAAQGQSA